MLQKIPTTKKAPAFIKLPKFVYSYSFIIAL